MRRLGLLALFAAALAVSMVVWTTGGSVDAHEADPDGTTASTESTTPGKLSVSGSAALSVAPD